MITDPRLLRISLVVLGLTLVGFLLHGALRLEPATVALTGAVVLMVVAREDPHEVLREVEWPTLFFFIGLFMLVAGVIEIGVIDAVAEAIVGRSPAACWPRPRSCVLWVSAVAVGRDRQHPVHRDDDPRRRSAVDRTTRLMRSGGRWRSARTWAATPRSSAPART